MVNVAVDGNVGGGLNVLKPRGIPTVNVGVSCRSCWVVKFCSIPHGGRVGMVPSKVVD